MPECAVIFDVDGVLLELTAAEEDVFFAPLASRYQLHALSRDWNAYRIRNDDDILSEILERHGLPAAEKAAVIADYINLLQRKLADLSLVPRAIPGAAGLLRCLQGQCRLGIATANLRAAARLRLATAGLWQPVEDLAFGAEGGGHKAVILARAVAALNLAPERIVFIGDNVNDVVAGRTTGVHFIGFSTEARRRAELAAAGATRLAADHRDTKRAICEVLGLNRQAKPETLKPPVTRTE
jgi:phosphoglycolate phosphatase-like HAD superfamily hydrolase